MAYQLIYTSAGKLLEAGKSGFGIVARSKALSPMVAGMVERVSQFANIRGMDRSRVIFFHRKLIAGSNQFHVISRIADAGVDYTGRTNHIAHHLIFSEQEAALAAVAGLNPADILISFVWLKSWEGSAKLLGPEDDVSVSQFVAHGKAAGRSAWGQTTGNPIYARSLAWEKAPSTGLLMIPNGAAPLALMSEALHECGKGSWSKTFTTSLEGTDELSDFDWILSNPDSYAAISSRCGSRQLLDLANPSSLPIPTDKPVVKSEPKSGHSTEATEARIQAVVAAPDLLRSSAVQTPRSQQAQSNIDAGLARADQAYKKRKKSGLLSYSVVIAAAVIVFGIIYALKGPSDDGVNDDQAEQANETDRFKKLLETLSNEGVSKNGLKDIEKFPPTHQEAWRDFIIGFNEDIKKYSAQEKLGANWEDVPENAGNPESVTWLEKMVHARKKLDIVINDQEGMQARLETLDQVYTSLVDAYEEGFDRNQKLSRELDIALTKHLIESVLGAPGSELEIPEHQIREFRDVLKVKSNNVFSENERKWRYEELCKRMQEMLDSGHPSLMEICSDYAGNPRFEEDFKGVLIAIRFKNGSLTNKLEDPELQSVTSSNILSENLKIELQGYDPNKVAGPVTDKPNNQKKDDELSERMKHVPPEQYILVTRADLEKGLEVQVPLLEELFRDSFKDAEAQQNHGLSVKMSPTNPDFEEFEKVDKLLLHNVGEDKFFAISMLKTGDLGWEYSIRYTQKGIIYNPKQKHTIDSITYTYTHGEHKKRATVIVLTGNVKQESIPGLQLFFTFQESKYGKNKEAVEAKCAGNLPKLLKKLYDRSGNQLWGQDSLLAVGNYGAKSPQNLIFENDLICKLNTKKPFFPIKGDIENVREKVKLHEEKEDMPLKGNQSERKERKNAILEASANAKEAIEYTIAHAIMANAYDKPGESVEGDYARLVAEAKLHQIKYEMQKEKINQDGKSEMVNRTEKEIARELIMKLAKKRELKELDKWKKVLYINYSSDDLTQSRFKHALKELKSTYENAINQTQETHTSILNVAVFYKINDQPRNLIVIANKKQK